MQNQIELSADVRVDAKGDEYYVVTPDMPITVDLSKVVLLVFHPPEGGKRGTVVIKPRRPEFNRVSRSHAAYKPVDKDPAELEIDFVEEVKRAEAKFEGGYVGLGFFLTHWKSSSIPFGVDIRKAVIDRLIAAGRVEQYQASDGKDAIKAVV